MSNELRRPMIFSTMIAISLFLMMLLSVVTQTAAFSFPFPKSVHYRTAKYFEGPRRISSSLASSPESNQDFASFLEAKERRDAVLSTTMFQKADGVIVEAIVQSMEKLPIQNNQQLFQQGEASDGSMYIVASGTFQCIEEETGEVKKDLEASDLFGEIAPEFGTERALTVKASSADASVWRIPYRDFLEGIKAKTDAFDKSLVTAIEQNPEYAAYFAMKERTSVFEKCAFFKPLQPRDFTEVVKSASLRLVAEGEVLFKEGDQGDTMYVVKEGSIDIVSEKSKKVLKTCKKGDSFGELAIFFSESNQRKASAQAAENTQVWEVNKNAFFDAVQESDLAKQALDAYREAKDKPFSFGEFWEYLKIKSRPKKKPVTLHSTFSIFSTGAAFMALGRLFSPGNGRYGFQIFDVSNNLTGRSAVQLQVAAWMMAATSVMGILRLPPKSPKSRKASFRFPMWAILMCSAGLSSNFIFHPTAWLYDGFKFPGNFLLLGIGFLGQIDLLRMMDDAIVGSNKGREANALATTRISAFAVSLLFLTGYFLLTHLSIPFVLSSSIALTKESALKNTELGLNGFGAIVYFFIIMQASFGSFINTLQFEKKIKPRTGNVLGLLLIALFNFDITVPFRNKSVPANLTPKQIHEICPAFTFAYWGVALAVILNAFRRRMKSGQGNEQII